MGVLKIDTSDYLFMKYRSMTVELMTIVSDYYPHLSKAEALRKANNQEFPFSVFRWCIKKYAKKKQVEF